MTDKPCIVAVVGWKDHPTDAIREYCAQLGHALAWQGIEFELVEVSWAVDGWLQSLRRLWTCAGGWHGKRILFQYTALGWSRRGFPVGFVLVQYILRLHKVRFAIIYHDPLPFGGSRFVDRIRRLCQVWVMRKSSALAECAILTVPPAKVDWLPSSCRAMFLPVGANIPSSTSRSIAKPLATTTKTIGIFGVTGGTALVRETRDIASAVRGAVPPGIDLCVLLFGRNSLEAEPVLRRELRDFAVEVKALGLLEADAVTDAFSRVDVALFIRGGISTRRAARSPQLPMACQWWLTNRRRLRFPLPRQA